MYFRAERKRASDVSLSGALDADEDGGSLSWLDLLSEDMELDAHVAEQDQAAQVRRAVDTTLSGRERQVILLRYPLDGAEPLPQREVAKRFGISRSYVSRIEKKALEKLREALDAT